MADVVPYDAPPEPRATVALGPGPRLHRIAFWPDRFAAAVAALCAELRLPTPAPGRRVSGPGVALARVAPTTLWLFDGPKGRAAPFIGPEDGAAVEIGPGLAVLSVRGPDSAALLARALPLDLRPASFPPNAIATTGWRHASVSVMRAGAGFELLVPRSFADDFAGVLAKHARQFG